MANEKIKILGAVLELLALPIQPIHQENGPNGLNWQCCLAGSSKTAPRIFIFSMAMDADYTFELISIKTSAPQFKWHNKSFLGSVISNVEIAKRCNFVVPFYDHMTAKKTGFRFFSNYWLNSLLYNKETWILYVNTMKKGSKIGNESFNSSFRTTYLINSFMV